MKDTSNMKFTVYDYIFYIFIISLLLVALIIPIKESISCVNKNCKIKDYSILATTTNYYNLSDITLETRISRSYRSGRISLIPISKCSYSSLGKAEDDMYKLKNQDNVVSKHISISTLGCLGILIFLFWIVLSKKKFTKYIIIALSIRLLYLLIV